ncbi:hypothetical protein TthTF28_03340 [Thermus thermophilus]
MLDEPDGEGPVPLPGQGGEEAEVARPPRGGGVGEEGEGPLQPVRVLGLKEGLPPPTRAQKSSLSLRSPTSRRKASRGP